MKFCTSILALAALCQTSDAFMTQAPQPFATKLQSSPEFSNNEARSAQQSSYSVNGSLSKRQDSMFGAPVSRTRKSTREIFEDLQPVTVQGGSLRTCSFSQAAERVTVCLKTDGRPLNADVDLWQGPDNTPQRMTVYVEDGALRPFRATMESPGSSNAVAIRNTGMMEFPITAGVEADLSGSGGDAAILAAAGNLKTVQGGAVYTTPFPPSVGSVEVMLKSDGRPLNARIELLQGPNNNKQVMEVYSEDGKERPFYCILDTPGSGNVVRIVNTATVEFPLAASIEAYSTESAGFDEYGNSGDVMTWS